MKKLFDEEWRKLKVQNFFISESQYATQETVNFFTDQLISRNLKFPSMKIKIPITLSKDEQSKHSPDARKVFPDLVQTGSRSQGGSQFSISLYIVMLIAERLYTKILTEEKDYKNITNFSECVGKDLHIYFQFHKFCGQVDRNNSEYCKFQGHFHFFKDSRKVGIAYHAYPESKDNYDIQRRGRGDPAKFPYNYKDISDFYNDIMR